MPNFLAFSSAAAKSSPWPTSTVTVMTWASHFSWRYLIRTDVSSPPLYAKTNFSVVMVVPPFFGVNLFSLGYGLNS